MKDDCGVSVDDEPVVIELEEGPWVPTHENNILMGLTTPQLLKIVYAYRKEIDFLTFAPRLCLLLVISLFNAFFAAIDALLFGRAVAKTEIPKNPVLVIGLPRSGTTLLYNLLSLDDQFVVPNTFQVAFPSCFLSMQRFANSWPLSALVSPTRPMDALPLSWAASQEDEIATMVLSGGISQNMAMHFMRAHRFFLRYVSFEDPSTRDAFARWRAAFFHFCRKVVYGARPGQRLLLKSPVNTGRVAMLNALFGGTARFVLIHRNPHEVFQSHHAALIPRFFRRCLALQTFDAADAQSYTLMFGSLLHRLFMRDAAELPPGRRGHSRVRRSRS